jgi:hypothetical protein
MIPANDRRALPVGRPLERYFGSPIGSGMERAPYLRSSFGHTLPNTMRPSFLNDGSDGAKGDIMIERAEEARPRSEIVWVALYSGLVLLLMVAWTT